jgi:hypothetical protein
MLLSPMEYHAIHQERAIRCVPTIAGGCGLFLRMGMVWCAQCIGTLLLESFLHPSHISRKRLHCVSAKCTSKLVYLTGDFFNHFIPGIVLSVPHDLMLA